MSKLLKTSIAGTVIVAVCCFTPVLAWLLFALGLTSALPYLDIFLLPALGFFIALTLWAFVANSRPG